MYSRLSKQTSKFQFSFGKNKIRTLPLRNCRSRFEKISNNLLLKVSYRFFLHNLLVFFSLLLSSCLVSKSYCGTKNTETRPFHRWSMGPRQWDCHRCLREETWLALRESSIGCAFRPCEVASEYWIAPPPSTCNCRSTKKCRSTI